MALALLDAKKINYWKVRIPNAGGYHEVDETFILSKITRKSIQTDMLESDLMNTDFTIYLLHPKKSDTKFFKKYVSNQLEMCTISVKSGMELEIVKLGGLGLYKFNRETTTEGCGLVKSAGKEDFVELNSSLTL
uniref:Uncharacterized protein n=1 Tax=Rhizophagus irregularis (strain DAOM 181602 / DAOM 197198 / MUCL 43194) TaxID=747089 RepID=U9TBV6_RHIID